LRFYKESKYGCINESGKVVIPPKFGYAKDFNEGRAVVLKNGKIRYIKKSGEYIKGKYKCFWGFFKICVIFVDKTVIL